jgi:hypothetical protein
VDGVDKGDRVHEGDDRAWKRRVPGAAQQPKSGTSLQAKLDEGQRSRPEEVAQAAANRNGQGRPGERAYPSEPNHTRWVMARQSLDDRRRFTLARSGSTPSEGDLVKIGPRRQIDCCGQLTGQEYGLGSHAGQHQIRAPLTGTI